MSHGSADMRGTSDRQGSTDAMRACARMCHECHDACVEQLPRCLARGSHHAETAHITMLLDCAQACATAEDFLHRGSALHIHTCLMCAEVCRECARSCDAMAEDDRDHRCAELCRKCEDSCRRMLNSHG